MTDVVTKVSIGGQVYPFGQVDTSVAADDVSYDNTTSGMTADNVQDALDEVFQSVSNGKTLIAAAITDKGVSTAATDSFSTMATNIRAIDTSSSNVMMYGLKLYNNRVSGKDGEPRIYEQISRKEGGKYYGCCVYDLEGTSATSYESGVYTYRKTNNIDDMEYTLNSVTGTVSGSIYTHPSNMTFWTNGTNIKIIFFIDTTYSTNSYFCYEAVWDYKNTGTTVNTNVGRGETTNYLDYNVDLTGYTNFVPAEWVDSVTGDEINDNAYMYITLGGEYPLPPIVGDNYIELGTSSINAFNLPVMGSSYYILDSQQYSRPATSSVHIPAGNHTVKIVPNDTTAGWNIGFKLVDGVTSVIHDAPFSAYNVSTTIVADDYKKEFAENCGTLTSVSADVFTIPNTVTSIGNNFMYHMFHNCASLTTVGQISIPDSVTSIGDNFMDSQYYNCYSLTTPQVIDLGDGLQSIGNSFMNAQYGNCTSLTTTAVEDMPDSLSTIGSNFRVSQYAGCTALTSAQDEVMTSSLTSIGVNCRKNQFKGCTSLSQSADEIVTSTGTPSSSFTIGNEYKYGQYEGCTSLTETGSEAMPNVPTAIGYDFKRLQYTGCTALTTLSDEVLSNSTTSIGNYYRAEQYANTAPITNTANETTTGTAAVGGTTIGNYYKYRQYYMNSNVTTAGTEALPSGTNTIGTFFRNGQYHGCTSLTSTAVENIGNNVTTIGSDFRNYQYYGCTGLTSAQDEVLTNTLTNIGSNFRYGQYGNCTTLTTTGTESLPSTITSIGTYFRRMQYSGCTSLTNIKGWKDLSVGNTNYRYQQFNGCNANKTVKVLSDVGYNAQSNTLSDTYVTEVQVPTAYLSNFTSTTTIYPRRSIDDSKFVGY